MSIRINPIARFAVDRRVTMGTAVLGVMVLGGLSLARLPLEFLPSFSSNSIWVQAPYPSSSPEEIERRIVRPLEDMLGTISGIDTLSASATASGGNVSLTFKDGVDMDLAAVEVRDRIDRVRHLLPADLRRVSFRRFQSTDIPVFRFQVSVDWQTDRLYDFVENVLQRRLERLPGVAQISIWGLERRQIQVRLNPGRLRAHGIDVRDLATHLRESNLNVSGGHIKEGSRKLLVRSVGEFQSLKELRDLPLNGDGLRLTDVAEVEYTFPRKDQFNFLNGKEALTISVYKTSTANLLEVVDAVKAELREITSTPTAAGLELRPLRDASLDVRKGLGQLRNAGLVGGLLAIIFLLLFLRKVRPTLLVAIAIPVSVVLTFVIMYLLRETGLSNTTLNIISLMGLMLALGMLVDNSIVVIEAIFRRAQDLGEDPRTAALRGASEVAMPIIASTATTVCVFVPIIFMASNASGFTRFLKDIGSTICIVMVASLLVALTVVPTAATLVLKTENSGGSRLLQRMVAAYGSSIRFTLRHRFLFLSAAGALLFGSWLLLGTIERTITGRTMERQIRVLVDTPRHYSLKQTQALYEEAGAALVAQREELGIADIGYRYDRKGGRSRGGWRTNKKLDIFLVEEEHSRLSTREVQERVRKLLPEKAGVTFKLSQSRGHGSRFGVQVDLSGDDLSVLERLSADAAEALAELPWIRDVDTSLASGEEEIHVQVRRERAMLAGLSSRAVAFTVSNALSERPVSRINTADREVDLVMQFREEDRRNLGQLKRLPVSSAGAALPMGALADFSIEKGPRSIDRENRRAKISITANSISSEVSRRKMRDVTRIMKSLALPPGYEWSFGRWERRAQADFGGALFSLIFALLLVYLIMAALFESFLQPLTIMLSIPFALVGVALVLKLTNQSLNSVTNLGLIILIGVVVNNAIVLVDHINHLRWQGMPLHEAIVTGGEHRLRPIVMTAVTTILGLLPMVAPLIFPGWLGSPEGRAASWIPVGLVILGGLTTSTFLTLIMVPTVYSLMDDCARFSRRVVHAAATTLVVIALAGGSMACGSSARVSGEGHASAESRRGDRARGDDGQASGRRGGPRGIGRGNGPGGGQPAAVPVEVAAVGRRSISSFLETNGTLEAEKEVDIVARTGGPVVRLLAEEGMVVRAGQLLVQIDEAETRAQLEIARVALNETRRTFERARASFESELISQQVYDDAQAAFESAEARLMGNQILLGYTKVAAPFGGIIVERHVKQGQNVTPQQKLFRISDFDPLLCPIQIPEKELSRLAKGQTAHLTVDAWPRERFGARVLRISPVVDAATGTIKVTLEVKARGKLRPGMFASVYLVTDVHEQALAIPKAALSLESLGDTVYVVEDDVARRRDIVLGYEESDYVEVTSGLNEGDPVIVVGQDGLSDGTPIRTLPGSRAKPVGARDRRAHASAAPDSSPTATSGSRGVNKARAERAAGASRQAATPDAASADASQRVTSDQPAVGRDAPRGRMDPSQMTPEQLERFKERMRARGLSDEQIQEQIQDRLRQRTEQRP